MVPIFCSFGVLFVCLGLFVCFWGVFFRRGWVFGILFVCLGLFVWFFVDFLWRGWVFGGSLFVFGWGFLNHFLNKCYLIFPICAIFACIYKITTAGNRQMNFRVYKQIMLME